MRAHLLYWKSVKQHFKENKKQNLLNTHTHKTVSNCEYANAEKSEEILL